MKIPKGWRMLRFGTRIKKGDKFHPLSFDNNKWWPTDCIEFTVGWTSAICYIRRIKRNHPTAKVQKVTKVS